MRLLNVTTMKLEDHDPERTVYATLSHTWDKDEVLFPDIMDPARLKQLKSEQTLGYQKVAGACELASQGGFTYIWIDTCCIDKSSSAELSEAINSMFKWYQTSTVCYTYLSDVDILPDGTPRGFSESRWFTRGWTLQELLGPDQLWFIDRNWQVIGDRSSLTTAINGITGISKRYLDSKIRDGVAINLWLPGETVATRMGWASRRNTTRTEDMAYCLMGIFDINMPLLYGEGSKAFGRLQEEILKVSADTSILAWRGVFDRRSSKPRWPYLAESPVHFNSGAYDDHQNETPAGTTITALGLQVRLFMCPCSCIISYGETGSRTVSYASLAVLGCSSTSDPFARLAIVLRQTESASNSFERMYEYALLLLKPDRCEVLLHPDWHVFADHTTTLQSVEYDQLNFKEETIVLASDLSRQYFEKRVPLRTTITPANANLEHIDSLTITLEDLMDEGSPRGQLCGMACFSAGAGHNFVIWWGYVRQSPNTVTGPPGLWVNSTAVCFVQKWSDFSSATSRDMRLVDECWIYFENTLTSDSDSDDDSDDGSDSGGFQHPGGNDKFMIEPRALQRLFVERAQESVEYRSDGLHIRATIRRPTFLGQRSYHLDIEVLDELQLVDLDPLGLVHLSDRVISVREGFDATDQFLEN